MRFFKVFPVPPNKKSIIVYIGPFACRYSLPFDGGRFSNGSRWCSGWHRWEDDTCP